MSTQMHITVQPMDDTPPPRVILTANDHTPRITLADGIASRALVDISLRSHQDPAAWMRTFADRLNAAANQHDQIKGDPR